VTTTVPRLSDRGNAAGTELAIDAEDLGVRYDLRFSRKKPIRVSVGSLLAREKIERFWALRHVDLKLAHGESLGVIGPNGAGKSTLLQVLAGIMVPSEGSVEVRGSVSGLLTLGAGFDQELSGRDNILLGGAFLGLEDKVTRDLLPGIVEFADLLDHVSRHGRNSASGTYLPRVAGMPYVV
jgi:ABC-type polysaccharide/polyol phosphate transport system ATPase subunit